MGRLAGKPFFDQRPDAGAHPTLVPRDRVRLLLDQQRHVGVALEAVARAVEVEIQALLPQLLEARLRGGAVQVGADAHPQQLGLGDAGGQRVARIIIAPRPAQPAERVEQHDGRQAGGRFPAGLRRHLPRAPPVDARRARVAAHEVVLQTRLKILPLPHLLEKREAHLGVPQRHVAGAEQQARPAGAVRGAQAGRQKAQGAARALEVRDRRPAFPHQVDQCGMEGIGGADPVAQRHALLVRLPPLGAALRVRLPHPREHLPVRFGRAPRGVRVRRHCQQPPPDHVEDFVAGDRLPPLVLAGGQVLDGLQQPRVLKRLARARLQRVHQHRVVDGADRHGEPLQERQRLVAQRGLAHAHAAGADQVFQDFIEEDEARPAPQQLDQHVAAGRHARFVLAPQQGVAVRPAERPTDPSPDRARRHFRLRRALAGGGVEELAVHHRRPHPLRARQAGRFRQRVERVPRPGGVQQRGERVRLAAAERGHQLEHAVAARAGQPAQHVVEQRAQPGGEVGGGEEAAGVAVDGGHARQLGVRRAPLPAGQVVGQRPQVEREDVVGKLVRQDVGVQGGAFDPGP